MCLVKKIRNKKNKQLSLRNMILLLVCLTILFSLITSNILVSNYIIKRENANIREKIASIARIIARDERIITGVLANDFSDTIQGYTQDVQKDTGVDFIVVMNNEFTRFSHPETEYIEKTFSNILDAEKSINGKEHYSKEIGVLGEGTRFFTPIYDATNNQIGLICVGFTQKTVEHQIKLVQNRLFIGLSLGLIIGLAGAVLLARKIKQTLFGLEPSQIAANLQERQIIVDAVNEGIIAISKKGNVLLQNENAKIILLRAGIKDKYVKGERLQQEVINILFTTILSDHKVISNKPILLNQLDLIVSTAPIFVENKFYGAVATIQDQTERKGLIRELSGTNQYVDSLRAQSHNFTNQLHVISGLIELEKYDDMKHFFKILSVAQHEQNGFITKKFKSPAIAGFLLEKVQEGKEQEITLTIHPDSYFPNSEINDFIHQLLIAIGVLLDNAYEAIARKKIKYVSFFLHYDAEEKIIIIEIEDNGEGISDTTREKIFDRGFSTKSGNRGYGLDAVQAIIKQYNGIITVSSEPEKGSSFYLELPYTLEVKND